MMPVFNTEVKGKQETLVCLHWRSFPPWNKSTFPEKTLTQLWNEGRIDSITYQRALIWERVCNKFSMDDGCKDCEMVRKMGIHNFQPAMMGLDNVFDVIPTTDIPTFEALPKNRGYLLQGRHTRDTRPGARKK